MTWARGRGTSRQLELEERPEASERDRAPKLLELGESEHRSPRVDGAGDLPRCDEGERLPLTRGFLAEGREEL